MTTSVYDQLLARITLGDYAPGSPLNEKELAAGLEVSRTPVREALQRLRHEGLVRIIARGGIFVAEASIRQIREITEVRLVLEECSGRLAVARCTGDLRAELRGWLEDCEARWGELSARERMRRDMAFHTQVDRAAANKTLAQQLTILRHQAVLFWGQSVAERYALEPILAEYREVVAALEARDAERCVLALQQHVLQHVSRIQDHLLPESLPTEASARR